MQFPIIHIGSDIMEREERKKEILDLFLFFTISKPVSDIHRSENHEQ